MSLPETSFRLERQARLQADGAMVFICALWGATFVVVKDALGHGDPFSFLALRFGVGAAVLSVLGVLVSELGPALWQRRARAAAQA